MIFRECRLLNKSSAKVLSLSEKDCILRIVCLFKYFKWIANCTNVGSLFAWQLTIVYLTMRSIAFSLIFHKSMALVLTPIFVNLLKFLCHVSIISYLCCVVWLQPCGRLICGMWSVVLRSCSWNLRNFNAIQDEDDNGSRCMAWTDCICIYIAGFSQDLTKGCGANSSALLHIYFKV